MWKALLIITFLGMTSSTLAHEGHDKVPGAVLTPNGGQLADLKHMHLELVATSQKIQIYASDHDSKPISPKEVKLSAEMIFPRGRGSAPVALVAKDKHFEAAVDAKGHHRYTLKVTAEYKNQKDVGQFTVEPE